MNSDGEETESKRSVGAQPCDESRVDQTQPLVLLETVPLLLSLLSSQRHCVYLWDATALQPSPSLRVWIETVWSYLPHSRQSRLPQAVTWPMLSFTLSLLPWSHGLDSDPPSDISAPVLWSLRASLSHSLLHPTCLPYILHLHLSLILLMVYQTSQC